MSKSRIRTLIQCLRNNDPSLTDLDFRNVDGSRSYQFESGSALFRELLEALETNQTVQKVNIVLRFLHKLSHEEKIQLFCTIGSLPMLENLRVASSGLAGSALQLINMAISHCASHLKALTLHSIHFKEKVYYQCNEAINTEDEEFVEFLKALKNLQNLEYLALEDVEDTWNLDAVVNVLPSIPSLRHILFKSFAYATEPRLSEASLSTLFSSDGTLELLALK
jgi:hypothetical protein